MSQQNQTENAATEAHVEDSQDVNELIKQRHSKLDLIDRKSVV